MTKIVSIDRQLTIAQELAIQGQLNGRLYGVLQCLLTDLNERAGWDRFSGKLKNDCLYCEKYGAFPVSIKIGISGDYEANAKQLAILRQINRKLRSTVARLTDEIDTYSDPGFFQSWENAVSLTCATPKPNPGALAFALQFGEPQKLSVVK